VAPLNALSGELWLQHTWQTAGDGVVRFDNALLPEPGQTALAVRRQNILDKQRSSLRDSFQFSARPPSGPGTPSFFVPSFFF